MTDSVTAADVDLQAARPPRALAVLTLCTSVLLLVAEVPRIWMTDMHAFSPVEWRVWGWPEVIYFTLLILLAASLLVHAAQDEDAMLPRSIAVVAALTGVLGGFLAYWLYVVFVPMRFEGVYPQSYITASYLMFIVSILPFLMAFAAGLVLRRVDHRSPRFRVGMVLIIVEATALILLMVASITAWITA